MLIGTMNHPERNVLEEIAWMAEAGMEFLDLTLEPPGAPSWEIDTISIRRALDQHRMGVVGHTAWYLPTASAIPEIRHAALTELRRCLRKFGDLGAKWMNIHPDRHTPWHDRRFYIERNLDTFEELLPTAREAGVGLMIENLPGDYNSAPQLGDLLDRMPELGLHLDIGHANLQVPHDTTEEILAAYGDRLRHVHLHDNKGGHADLHLPLGTGTVNVQRGVEALQRCGYDGTITLEVFTPDRHHLTYSRDLLRTTWERSKEALASAHKVSSLKQTF
ncbi:MAG: sugar phosphate isomerase/epimerase [Acidobacteriaceae bacterium]|nr:sugar phosphate isomerase/epimerase [Acidobacteriaceae bacterium]MBV9782106.1 sugar phosphate isomerase/epimerase [Acidobacteriaceae bacterium]